MRNAVRILLKRVWRVCLVVFLTLTVFISRTMAYAADMSSAVLSFPDVTAQAGDTVDLDITITGNPGIIGMTLEVNYDSRLTLTSIKNGEAFGALEMTKPGVLEPGCRIHWDAVELEEGAIRDGVITTLTFTLSETIPSGSSCFVRVAGASENGQMDVYDTELQTVNLEAATGTISIAEDDAPQPVRVTEVTLDQSSISFTEAGQTRQLHALVLPESADDTSVSWSSSSQTVASVSAGGLVTALTNGQTVITATTRDGGFTATCTVDVNIPKPTVPVTGISLDRPTLNLSMIGECVQLKATVEPSDATDPSVRWASSDPSVATVSSDGLVTARAKGVATIMVSTVDGGYLKACVVTVAVSMPAVSIDAANVTLETNSCVYSGEAQTPAVVVLLDGEELIEDIDYKLSYEDNVKVGTATVVVRGKGNYTGTATATFEILSPFSDVSQTTAHVDDIYWLASTGISAGWEMADGTREFRPYEKVARADMAAFLFRLAKTWGLVDDSWQPSGSVAFRDVNARTPHYREIMWLAETGISQGWPTSGGAREFRPLSKVARADMAAFLCRLQALRTGLAPTAGGASPFQDVTSRTAHYGDILWLAESGVSQGWTVTGGKEFRPLSYVARADMAAFLYRMDALS